MPEHRSEASAIQPPPESSSHAPSWDVVIRKVEAWRDRLEPPPPHYDRLIADMRERDRMGRAKYGVRLAPFNGRDPGVDAYRESLDLVAYLQNEATERERHPLGQRAKNYLHEALYLALNMRRYLDQRGPVHGEAEEG